jgi:branched-chain amino acid transport system substrate-binding protein
MSLRSMRPIAAVLLTGLLLAACGGGGGSGSGSGGDPIRIAAIGGYSGGVSSNPEYADGANAAVAAINARGGINGRQVELELCDNHQNATDSANCYRKLLSDDSIVAIAGGSDNYHDASKAQLEAANIPLIGQYPVSSFDLTNPLAFNLNGSTVVGLHGLAQDVVAGGAKRVGLVTLDIPTADVIRKTVGDVLSAGGVQVTSDVRVSPTAADLSAPAQQVTQAGPDAVIWLTFAAQTDVAVKSLRQTGYAGTVAMAGSAFTKDALQTMGAGGPLSAGMVLPPAWDTTTTYGKQFNADMKAAAPNAKLTELSLNSWLGVQVFAQVAATVPKVDRASVLDALRKASNVETGGLTPPISFAAKSPLPYAGVYNPAYTVVHVTGGTASWDGKLYEFGSHKVLTPAP